MHTYVPTFASFDKLSATHLFPLHGPSFDLHHTNHSSGPEVRISSGQLTTGSMTLITMGVFASLWPGWHFAGRAAHIKIAWVVCVDPAHWDFFVAALKGTGVPLFSLDECAVLSAVHIIGVNDISSATFYRRLFESSLGCPLVITDSRVRCKLPPAVLVGHHKLPHFQAGGVTDSSCTLTYFTESKVLHDGLSSFQFPSYPFAPLMSLLDRKLTGKPLPAWRMQKFPSIATQVNSIGQSSGYHSHGLYPVQRGVATPYIGAPCVYPTTPWVLRKLSPSELVHVFDLPLGYISALGPHSLNALVSRVRLPLKPMTVALQHLFYYSWPPLSTPNDGSSNPDACAVPASDVVVVPGGGNSCDFVQSDSVELGPVHQVMAAGAINVDGEEKVVMVESENDTNASIVGKEACETYEDQKAVALKSDKAPVPVHVWRNQLSRILGVEIPVTVYERGADVLRRRLLRHWRRGLFRHFIMWVKRSYDRLAPEYYWCTGQFNWNVSHHSDHVTKRTTCVYWDELKNRYRWIGDSTGCSQLTGKQVYKDSWELRQSLLGKSWVAAKECMTYGAECSWWKWDKGSRLFFWRWPEEFVEEARDGCKCWFEWDKLPRYRVPQRPPSNPDMIDKIQEKLADVISKSYMADGDVHSLTSFFDVMKGLDDIRMVYNGTSCGLNDACWAPWFPLPTIKTHLRAVEAGTWLADIDLGEMFLNFLLDERLRAYAGVDVTLYFPELLKDGKSTVWKRWVRLLIGFTASPYLATRCLLRSRKILLGDRRDQNNPFRWDHAVKNYPGKSDYDPLRPMVYKVRTDGKIAADLMKYIDDLRLTSVDAKEIWEASMKIMTKINWLGMQNAARKYRDGALLQGAWTGAIVHTFKEVTASISQARWDKVKHIIDSMIKVMTENDGVFQLKQLLSDRGFLVYVSQTYPAMVPYLKGIHLTVDSWRPNRDVDGWKIPFDTKINKLLREGDKDESEDTESESKEIEAIVEEGLKKSNASGEVDGNLVVKEAPDTVKAANRTSDDLHALKELFAEAEPIKRHVRAKGKDRVKFGFGDASGDGYGSGLAKLKLKPNIRHGKWSLFYRSEDTSSNFRELRNLVDAIALDYERGLLDGYELFFFTDNQVAEKAYYKGTSSSRRLFELVLRLRKIEMEGRMIIHVIHISGKRMIACGIDGLSRGDTSEGIGAGEAMESFVPLHLDVKERSPGVISWIHRWWPQEFGQLTELEVDDWFIWDEQKENCLWVPAPAGGEAAVEELANWIHYNSERVHLVIMPTIWTCTWRKQLGKICDIMIALPNLFECWNRDEHFEPLTLGNPGGSNTTPSWLSWRGSCGKCKRTLTEPTAELFCANFCTRRGRFEACLSAWCPGCYKEHSVIEFPRVIPVDDEGEPLPCQDNDLFREARLGDTLMTPFQCDLCHFRNIKNRNPIRENERDNRALVMIRRANLDAFWARTSATVNSNLADTRQLIKHSVKLWGSVPTLPPRGPFPMEDSFGMAIATATLDRSLDKGRNAKYVQYNTARRIRSAYSNCWNSSLHTLDTGVMQDGQAKLMVTDCPVYHHWYTRMMKGMHERMGDLIVQDQAMSRELMIEIMKDLEQKLIDDRAGYSRWVEIGTYVMVLWLAALRGNEGMMADLGGSIEMMEESESAQSPGHGFGVLVLTGKFKSSTGFTKYLLYLSSETKSKFQTPFRGWLKRLLDVRRRQGKTSGWLFCKEDGSQLGMTHFEVDILRIIADIQDRTEGIIPKDMDVFDRYGVFRSWRRGATSIARNEGLSDSDIELNNWWRKMENSRGKHVSSNMLSYYTEDLLVIDAKQRFSKVL